MTKQGNSVFKIIDKNGNVETWKRIVTVGRRILFWCPRHTKPPTNTELEEKTMQTSTPVIKEVLEPEGNLEANLDHWFPVSDISLWVQKEGEDYAARFNQEHSFKISAEEFHTFFGHGEPAETVDGWTLYKSQGTQVQILSSDSEQCAREQLVLPKQF